MSADTGAHDPCTSSCHMSGPHPLSATVLICTFNRADHLRRMLHSLSATTASRRWNVLVVDNNSTDTTADVVDELRRGFPVPLTRVFEPRQGKSVALNTGIACARGDLLAFTDDDVVVDAGWLEAACRPLDQQPDYEYTGGPVHPIWEREPPEWIDRDRGDLWGTLAILDYGAEPFVFEDRQRVPLGANMVVRRRLVARIGGFHPDLGRRGRSLLGQEQAEFFARARQAGARGVYEPTMALRHHVPAGRLTRQYFRRWWYWKGVARARVDALHARTELGLDLRNVPHVGYVPRFIWGQMPRALWAWTAARLTGRPADAMRQEMHLIYAAGYVRACWDVRPLPPPPAAPREAASPLR